MQGLPVFSPSFPTVNVAVKKKIEKLRGREKNLLAFNTSGQVFRND
jgi:hypothetical protein